MLVWLALLAFAVGLGRSFLDWGIVYPELGGPRDPVSVFARLAVYSLIFGTWAWSIVAIARGQRRGAWAALVITLLANVALGVTTTVALCPSPCPTVWPVGELWNWATTLSGLAAVIALIRALRAPQLAPSAT